MMQRDARAADFFHQRIATGLQFLEIGRTERRFGRPGKNQVGHFEIAHRPVVRRGHAADFFRNAKRRFTRFIRRPDIPHDRRKDAVPKNDQRQIAHLAAVRLAEARRQHDVGIGRADQKAEFLQRLDLIAHRRDSTFQIAFALGRRRFHREFRFVTLQSFLRWSKIGIRDLAFLRPAITRDWFEVRR